MDYCSICPRKRRPVPAHGPQPTRYLAIGEAPGREEDRAGIPFVGASGREWNENYLDLAGLRRDEIRVTNAVLCRPDQNRKPKPAEVIGCAAHHLAEEIARTQPEIIFLLGSTACSLVPEIQLDVEHGIPRWSEDLYGWTGWVVPLFHPAAGLHDTGMMVPMLEDWEKLNPWLETDEWAWPVDPHPRPYYRLIRDVREVDHYFLNTLSPNSLCAVDTESHQGTPFSIQLSIRPGTGIMILLDTARYQTGTALQALPCWLKLARELVFHNASADLSIVQSLIDDSFQYRDTMQEAYQLGNLPQGLKALGYRLCGVKMQSWEDLVTPYSKAALVEWMKAAIELECGRPKLEEKQLKTRIRWIDKPNDNERLLRRVLRHTLQGTEYDPWQRLNGISSVNLVGDYPLKGIAHVTVDDAVQYGCRDADITLRVALRLQELRREAEESWSVPVEDHDECLNRNPSRLQC